MAIGDREKQRTKRSQSNAENAWPQSVYNVDFVHYWVNVIQVNLLLVGWNLLKSD